MEKGLTQNGFTHHCTQKWIYSPLCKQAKGGYRFIYPGAGGPRGQGPDFWISAGAPGLAARGENSDIFWEKSYGSAAERGRWDHMSCDTPSTWYGYRLK